jgi:Uma2 family endonuclease
MGHPAKVAEFTAQDYLAWESARPDKNELLGGAVFAMVGASRRHVTVALNLATLLSVHLRGSACRAYMSDMKLRIEGANAFFYPDVLVTCDPKDHQAENYVSSPILVAEVLSPSSEAYDRGAKFTAYRKVPTLQEYLLIDPETQRVEIYRAATDGQWVLSEIDPNGTLRLKSVDLEIKVPEIFENV